MLVAAGRYDMALDWLARAEPREPGRADEYTLQRALHLPPDGTLRGLAARNTPSVEDMRRRIRQLSHAITLVNLGRIDEARGAVRAALEDDPEFTQAVWREGAFYSDPAVLDGEVAALARAGLPEG